MSTDTSWYRDINDFAEHTAWLHGVMAAYALWAGLAALVALWVAAWVVGRRGSQPARSAAVIVLTGAATVAALLLNQNLVSPDIARTRPCHRLSDVETLLACKTDYSFPSDHAVIAGALAAGLLLVSWRIGVIATTLALLLAFSRVYVGVHYPSDVAAGLAMGGVVTVLVVLAGRRLATALATRLSDTPLRFLITS